MWIRINLNLGRLCCWLSSNDHWPFYAGFEISKKEKGSGDYSSMVSVQEAGWQPVAVVGWHWEKVSQSARTQRCPEDEGNILLETGVCIYFLSQVLGKPIKKIKWGYGRSIANMQWNVKKGKLLFCCDFDSSQCSPNAQGHF